MLPPALTFPVSDCHAVLLLLFAVFILLSFCPQIQEAYATLSDPAKRREYDSVDEFDDSLPLECDRADFFKVGVLVGFLPASFLCHSAFLLDAPPWRSLMCLLKLPFSLCQDVVPSCSPPLSPALPRTPSLGAWCGCVLPAITCCCAPCDRHAPCQHTHGPHAPCHMPAHQALQLG